MLRLDFLGGEYEKKKTPAEAVEESIEIDVLTGRIPIGKRINEQDLCKKYNMSRTPIREILRRIEGKGLIQFIPNRGVFASGPTPQDVDDIFYLKTLLEVQCVRWAIERIDAEQMDLLEEIFDFMQFYTMSEDLDKILRINDGFDSVIYNAAHNRELERRLHRYNFIINYANSEIKYPMNYLPVVLEEHRAIFDAFKAKDPAAGAEATEVHMYKTMLRRK